MKNSKIGETRKKNEAYFYINGTSCRDCNHCDPGISSASALIPPRKGPLSAAATICGPSVRDWSPTSTTAVTGCLTPSRITENTPTVFFLHQTESVWRVRGRFHLQTSLVRTTQGSLLLPEQTRPTTSRTWLGGDATETVITPHTWRRQTGLGERFSPIRTPAMDQ